MNHRKLLPTLFIILACIAGRVSGAEEKLQDLRVEYAANPMTVEAEHPCFSWEMQTDPSRRGEKQTAYQIVVSNEAGEEVWNTGKVKSDVSLHVRYAGQALQPATRYTWELTVWDGKNKKNRAASWFETGLMGGSDAYRGWSGAQWIGGSPEDNAAIALNILKGKGTDAQNAAIAVNTSALLYLADRVSSFKEGYDAALSVIKSGIGLEKLCRLCSYTEDK